MTRDPAPSDAPATERRLYEELSRINNELVTTQRALVKKNAELARLHEEKNALTRMAAHDIRSPLSVITAYAELLGESAGLDLAAQEQLESIRSLSTLILDMVDDLLDASCVESGTLPVDPVATDVVAMIRRNVELNRALAEKRGIALHLETPPAALEARVDPHRIDQLLNNLIGNAIKFSPPGSEVDVSLRGTGDRLRLRVRDHGPGIPAEDLDRMQRPLTRGDRSTRGWGLGLAIARALVKAHHGRLHLDNAAPSGLVVTVTLPYEPPIEEPPHED